MELPKFSVSREDLGMLKSSFEAVLSPEVAAYLRLGDGDLVRAKKWGSLDCPLVIRVNEGVRKNCVVVDPVLSTGCCITCVVADRSRVLWRICVYAVKEYIMMEGESFKIFDLCPYGDQKRQVASALLLTNEINL